MTALPKSVRLESLRFAIGTATTMIRELDANHSLLRLAEADPERWNYVLDSLNATMEADDMGTMAQVLNALSAALDR